MRGGNRSQCRWPPLARAGDIVAEDAIEYGDLDERYQQSTFGAHFVEVAVDADTARDPRAAHAGGLRAPGASSTRSRRAAR